MTKHNNTQRKNMTTPEHYLRLDAELSERLITYLNQNIIPPVSVNPEQIAYRWVGGTAGRLEPIKANFSITLNDLQGIDKQKEKIIDNTRQFLAGYPANHVLMTGTRGAGKSSLIKALLHAFHQDGLRMIEVSRDDLQVLDKIRNAIDDITSTNLKSNNPTSHKLPQDTPCRYIVYCDDLAFNAQDENYRTLKSVLDGALDSEQDNLLVYATSNRRHLLPQMMKDNINIYDGQTDEVNPYETIDETVSLSDRFGLWLSFNPMNQATYLQIVEHYLAQSKLNMTEHVRTQALLWASTRGGRSGRIAYQFTRHWVGKQLLKSNSDGRM